MFLIYFCSESGKWSPWDFCGLFCKSRTEEGYSFDISQFTIKGCNLSACLSVQLDFDCMTHQ